VWKYHQPQEKSQVFDELFLITFSGGLQYMSYCARARLSALNRQLLSRARLVQWHVGNWVCRKSGRNMVSTTSRVPWWVAVSVYGQTAEQCRMSALIGSLGQQLWSLRPRNQRWRHCETYHPGAAWCHFPYDTASKIHFV